MTFQTFSGMNYLKIDVASNFGLDKKTWDERIAWTNTNMDKLEELVHKADEPALYFASVRGLRQAQSGEPSGYPISLDATSSGLQILACLTGDANAASICNVVDEGARMDAYTIIYDIMLSLLGEEERISRTDVKSAVMTLEIWGHC